VKENDFDKVDLACGGENIFVLDGAAYKTIGQEYTTQNAIYTIRTFPEKLKFPDGSPAYETWTGGILGVMGQQMEDFNNCMVKWLEPCTH